MKSKTWINLIVLSGLLFASFGVMPATQPKALAASVIRVKPAGSTAAGCGDTWANACELQTALASATTEDEIWVAAGTYKPGTNREDTFQLINGVGLYGGFGGAETSRGQRDWKTNVTVLSGDIGVEDDKSDNSYHVVSGVQVQTPTIMDGFTITRGNADGQYPNNRGGGISIVFYSNPILTNLIISDNSAEYGGGMYTADSGPILTNVTFNGNLARGEFGGGLNNYFSDTTLTNVTFSGNSAGIDGGGIYNQGGSPIIINSILWGNPAGISGQEIYNEFSTPSIKYSYIQGGCASIAGNDCSGGGNIDADPLFLRNPTPGPDDTWGTMDDDYGDLHPRNGSPVTDAGDNSALGLAGISSDLDGNPRFYDVPEMEDTGVGPAPIVDLGAYEKQANNAPAAEDDTFSTDEDILLDVAIPGVLANDSDPNSDPLSAVLESGPSNGQLTLDQDGSFEYLPERNFDGVVTFDYHATDGLLVSNTATVTIIISNVDREGFLPLIVKGREQ